MKAMRKSRAKRPDAQADAPRPVRRSAVSVPVVELQERLARARAALAAVKRAPHSKEARTLETDLSRQIRILSRDIAQVL